MEDLLEKIASLEERLLMLKKVFDAGSAMRRAQKEYYHNRNMRNLKAAIEYEKQFDELLDSMSDGIDPQLSLFK